MGISHDRLSAAKTRLAQRDKQTEPSVSTGAVIIVLAMIIGAITCVHLWVNTPRPQAVSAVKANADPQEALAKLSQAEAMKKFDLWNDYTGLAMRLYPDAAKADSKLSLRAATIQKRLKDAGEPMADDILSGIYCIHEAAKELGIKPDESKENELALLRARNEAVARNEQARNARETPAANEEIQALKNKLAEMEKERDEASNAAEWNYQLTERQQTEINRLKGEVAKGNATINQLATQQPVYIYRTVPSASGGSNGLDQLNNAANQRAVSDLQRQWRDYDMRPSWRK